MKLDELVVRLKDCEGALANTAHRKEKIYQPVEGWIVEYPEIEKIVDGQMHTFWPWDEHKVSLDTEDLRVNCTVAEREAIIYCLLLFTHYELRVGEDYWMNRIGRRFKRPEFQRMATMFSAVELNSHAPFYNEANRVLYLDNEDFYSRWKEDTVLTERMEFIEAIASSKDDLISIAGFSIIEGAILYSSFAFFKHFQAQECGKDLMKSFCRGINMSVGDENTHAVGGAWLFNHLLKERNLTNVQKRILSEVIYNTARVAYEHEAHIVDKIFSFGDIKGIKPAQLKSFVAHRINLCLTNLGLTPLEELTTANNDDFIESWFYKNINMVQFHDFFTGGGSEYDSSWERAAFATAFTEPQKILSKPVIEYDDSDKDTFSHYLVYTKEGCRFCDEAKAILSSFNVPFNHTLYDKETIKDELNSIGANLAEDSAITLPKIVRIHEGLDPVYVGGGEDLVNDLIMMDLIKV